MAADRFLVPFTFAGHLSAAAVSIAVADYVACHAVVRACYPAGGGCFDPVVSAAMVVEDRAPVAGSVVAAYGESATAVTVQAQWNHFSEVRLECFCWSVTDSDKQLDVTSAGMNTTVGIYQWTLATTPTGAGALLAWQAVTAAAARNQTGVIWTNRFAVRFICVWHIACAGIVRVTLASWLIAQQY